MKMSKFEKKFGKYAIPNLTLILIICYIAGYVINFVNPTFTLFLTLDPYQIIHGQLWRLFTWILIPPSSFDLFTIIMLLFYYSLGTSLERTWGTYRYNVYIFQGIFCTIVASFLYLGVMYLMGIGQKNEMDIMIEFLYGSAAFSTYFINMSIFLAYAATYPEMQVLVMFLFPVKVKWIAILDVIMLAYQFIIGGIATKFAVAAALISFGIFYLKTGRLFHLHPKQMKRRADFKSEVKRSMAVTRHKCAICGRTEESHPDLEFRFCSKCNGNYEYCQEHLFTHEHVK